MPEDPLLIPSLKPLVDENYVKKTPIVRSKRAKCMAIVNLNENEE